jgi:hypothetical protein
MRKTYSKPFFTRLLFAFACVLALAGCGKLDDFDADEFDFFDDDPDKVAALRTYSTPGMSDTPLVEYIVDNLNQQSKDYEGHIEKMCDYTKLPYRSVDVKAWSASPVISPTTRVICLLETKNLSQAAIDKLIDFVSTGGTIFLPFASEDHRIAYLIGFKPTAEYATDTKSSGFHFNSPVLPNMKDSNYGDDVVHFGFAKENFNKNIRVLATAVNNPNYPLIIENVVGKGKVFFYNTSDALEKIDRGLLFSGILKGVEGIPYPIANTSTIFLDDFPSPVYNIKSEPVTSEMDMTITDFVKKVWWPDMIDLAKKYKINYSAMIAFDYKNKVDPPFIFDQWDVNKIRSNKKIEPIADWLVRDVAKNGHELAFHGYNHVSLKKELWPNQQFIGTSLKAVQKKWEVSNYGPMPVTYVPPSNIIDKEGVRLLKQGMPSLQYMCSLYLGAIEEGGGREFDFDPYDKGFFDYPRISSGFYLNAKTKYSHESMYLFTGIWTHFVHPDDIYQIPAGFNKSSQGEYELRNGRGLGWKKTKGKNIGLLTEFDDYLKEMTTAFPQMRFVNTSQGGSIVNDWRASKFKHSSDEGSYTVAEISSDKSLSDTQYWFLYGSFENALKIEAQLRNESVTFSKTPYLDGSLYTIYSTKPKLTLRDLKYKNAAQAIAAKKVTKKVQDEYKKFTSSVNRFLKGGNEPVYVDDTESKFKLELATLKQRMTTEAKIDSVTWNKYAKYMNWEDRGAEVWKMLEEHCVKHPLTQNIMYSKELSKIVDYPNDLSREKWMSAQLLVTPNDRDLLNSYVADFYTPENQEKIKDALRNLLKVDTSFDTYLKYLEHLLTYDTAGALEELKDKKPSQEYQSLATDITWLYSNEEDYQKAYEWSLWSDEIDFASKMSWLIEMKAYKILDVEYKKYIAKSPDDYKVKATMADVYYDTGRFRDSWILANKLPETPEKSALQITLNKDVVDVDKDLQQELLDNHEELFLPDVKAKLTKSIRKEHGNFIAFDNVTESNKNDPSAFKNVLSYNFYDSKDNLHSIAGTYSTMYKVNINVKDPDNVTHAVGGIQYQFNNAKAELKPQYWSKARLEYSDFKKFYFQLGAGINLSREKSYKSAELKIFPMETGPAHSKMIYRSQLLIYQDYYFLKHFNGSLALEGNYYTESHTHSEYTIDQSFEGSITAKFLWDDGKEKKSKFLPFVEGSLSQASIGKSIISTELGYPYWMIDDRLYGGGGIGWKYGLSESDLTARLEAGWFADDYANDFKRFTGEVAYQIFDFTKVTATFEVYVQQKFYSNAIQFGIKHNLKKKKKKK